MGLVIKLLKIIRDLGTKVISTNDKPNGFNNKNCGSTYPSKIKSVVKKFKANVGISFDGDADKLCCVMKKAKL